MTFFFFFKCIYPYDIQDVDEFVSLDLKKFSGELKLENHITCSPMDPLQWMGAVRIRVQTADKKHHNNPQVIHTNPVHQLMSCIMKSCLFVRNKSITKFKVLTLNCRFCPKYPSLIYTGTSQKIRISWKKFIFFIVTFQKVKLSYILDSLHVK